MKIPSPRTLDRAAERRWPWLFRFSLRQTLWSALFLQVVALLDVLLTDDASLVDTCVAVTAAMLARALFETRHLPRAT